MKKSSRESWSGQLGFILASAASAIGLGNLWRFPYLTAKYGGGIFLLVYFLLLLTIGAMLMTTEIALGRKTRLSPLHGFGKLVKSWSFLGILFVAVSAVILPYYIVIGGWILKYVFAYAFIPQEITDAAHPANTAFFSNFISNPSQSLLFAGMFFAMSALFIVMGVKNGIEKMNKILMPALFFLAIAIAGYVCMQPNAIEGIKYYLVPDLNKFYVETNGTSHFSFTMLCKTIVAAMGQMFFSLSLAMGIMVTYGSYMKKSDNIENSTWHIEFCDTIVAIIAGLMIIPAAFAFPPAGLTGIEAVSQAGPGLLFETLPRVFTQMQAPKMITLSFFVLVLAAALTSSVSMMETLQSSIKDKMKWSRKKSVTILSVYILIMMIPHSLCYSNACKGFFSKKILGMEFLSLNDFLANSVLMPLGAFALCIFVGWILKPNFIIREIETKGNTFKLKKFYSLTIKWIAPIFIAIILVTCILSGLKIIDI